MGSNGLRLTYTNFLKRAPSSFYNAHPTRSKVCDQTKNNDDDGRKRHKEKTCSQQVKALHDRDTRPVSHVIMDMDNIVLDSSIYNTLAHEEYLMKWKKSLNKHTKYKIMGMRNVDAGKLLTDELDMPFDGQVYAHGVWQLQRGLYPNAKVTKGIDDVICYFLKQRMPLALVSSAHNKAFKILYSRLKGLGRHFCHVVHGDHVENGKPNPETFLKAAKMFYAAPTDLAKYLVIDGSYSGAKAARAAGMQVIMCTDRQTPKEMQSAATVVLHDIRNFDPTEFHLPEIKKK